MAELLPVEIRQKDFDWEEKVDYWNGMFAQRLNFLSTQEDTDALKIDMTHYCRLIKAVLNEQPNFALEFLRKK